MTENGSTLVLVMVFLTIFIILGFSLFNAINSNINNFSNNENRIIATYKAEAGIEEALNQINNNPNITTSELTNISGNLLTTNDYSIVKAKTPLDDDINYYEVTAEGKAGNYTKEISVIINLYSTTEAKTLNTEGNIHLEYNREKGKGKSWKTEVENNNIASKISVPEIDFDDFNNYYSDLYPNTVKYSDPDNDNFKKIISTDEINTLTQELIYVKGDLEISDNGNNNSLIGETGVKKILVEGDINLEGIRKVENIIFVVLGNFYYIQPNAQINFDNVFIYSGKEVNMSKSKGNITLSPHFNFSGKIISKDDITIYSKDGLVNEENFNIEIPYQFKNMDKITIKKTKIETWQE